MTSHQLANPNGSQSILKDLKPTYEITVNLLSKLFLVEKFSFVYRK